jgi:iron(III) transport system substrate-binding protein
LPVREGTLLDPVVEAWGSFRPDPVNIAVAGRRQAEAVRMMDRVGWR